MDILFADIDQFCTVRQIADYDVLIGSSISYYIYKRIKYLPKEFFNMVQLVAINFMNINWHGKHKKSKLSKNKIYMWKNLVNLEIAYHLYMRDYYEKYNIMYILCNY